MFNLHSKVPKLFGVHLLRYKVNFKSTLASSFQSCNTLNKAFSKSMHTHSSLDSQLLKVSPISQCTKIDFSVDTKSAVPSHPKDKDFQPIYKFPYIVHVHTICRLKIIQTALVVTLFPALALFNNKDIASLLGCCTAALLMLGVVGEVARKFVGFVYYHPKSETVCISHLSFWGKRTDSYHKLSEIIPLTDSKFNPEDVYSTFGLYSKPNLNFWLSLKFGIVLNDAYFTKVFGDVHFKSKYNK